MALFDYSARLENAYQILTGSNPEWTSETYVNPSDDVFFQSIFNAGHDGATIFLEYDLTFILGSTSQSEVIAYKWQYRESGGSWTDLISDSATSPASPYQVTAEHKGIYTTEIDLPIEVRLIGTDADATWYAKMGDAYDLFFRAVGTVT